jgi:prophage regulatory protein
MTTEENRRGVDPVLRIGEVQTALSYSASQIYRMVKAGGFPPPLRLGPGRIGWRQSVVEHWLQDKENS